MRFNDINKHTDEVETEVDPEVAFFGDVRRKRLLLSHINSLRKSRDLENFENKTKLTIVRKMYARSSPI